MRHKIWAVVKRKELGDRAFSVLYNSENNDVQHHMMKLQAVGYEVMSVKSDPIVFSSDESIYDEEDDIWQGNYVDVEGDPVLGPIDDPTPAFEELINAKEDSTTIPDAGSDT